MKSKAIVFILGAFYLLSGSALSAERESSKYSREELIQFVNLSPLYVDLHQKENWVGLFAQRGFVEDPVGGYHFSNSLIPHFWNAFIAKNNIKFQIAKDTVSGMTVMRDAVVDAYLPTVGAHVYTPAHLRYDLTEEEGKLKVKSLRAYWSMPEVTKNTLGRGRVGLDIMNTQLKQIVQALGTKVGMAHFLKASMGGVKKIGERRVHKFGKTRSLKHFLKNGKVILIKEGKEVPVVQFFKDGYDLQGFSKVISSGNSVGFNASLKTPMGEFFPIVGIANFKGLKILTLEIFQE